jgi:hypothetical protein
MKSRLVGRPYTLHALRIAFPVLVLACTIASLQVMHLFGVGSRLAHLSGAATVFLFLVYVYTGLRPNDPESLPRIRQVVRTKVLDRIEVLIALCSLLLAVLVMVVWIGVSTETLVFAPETDAKVQVLELENKQAHAIGTASSNDPLKQRFFSGVHRFQFSVEGYEPIAKDVRVAIAVDNMLGNGERSVFVELRSKVDFVLRDLREGGWSGQSTAAEALSLPKELAAQIDNPADGVAFSLASSSPTPLWVQNLYLRVVDVRPVKQSTFPYYPGGAAGEPPIPGYAELKPEPGLYPVTLAAKAKLGNGIDPSDFSIRVFSEPGYRYVVRPEVHWVDVNDQQREGDYSFDAEVQLDVPGKVTEWQDLVRTSHDNVRILFGNAPGIGAAQVLGSDLQYLEPLPNYTILTRNPGTLYEFERIARISNNDAKTMANLLGHTSEGAPPGFMIIDGRVLLVQDQGEPGEAEIIEDSDRIAAIEKAYDTAAERAGLEAFTLHQDEVPAVRSTIFKYYEALGVGNLEKAYSYLGPTARSRQSQDSWIKAQTEFRESLHLQGTHINTIELGDVEEHKATATADVNWEDNLPGTIGDVRSIQGFGLVKDGGEWRLDELRLSEQVPLESSW